MGLDAKLVAMAEKLDGAFDGAWKRHDDELAKLTQAAWKSEKSLAGVQSAKWFQKSNNIGPKLATMQSARGKFDGQINRNNYSSLTKALKELSAALSAFEKNRTGSDASKDAKIKGLVKDYQDVVDSAKAWLDDGKQLLVVTYRDEKEGRDIVSGL